MDAKLLSHIRSTITVNPSCTLPPFPFVRLKKSKHHYTGLNISCLLGDDRSFQMPPVFSLVEESWWSGYSTAVLLDQPNEWPPQNLRVHRHVHQSSVIPARKTKQVTSGEKSKEQETNHSDLKRTLFGYCSDIVRTHDGTGPNNIRVKDDWKPIHYRLAWLVFIICFYYLTYS